MPAQNKSIIQHLKTTLLGCIIDQVQLNLGDIIVFEIFVKQRQQQMSLPFLIRITQLCKLAKVPFIEATNVLVTSIGSSDICRIKAYYLGDVEARRRPSLVDATFFVDLVILETKPPILKTLSIVAHDSTLTNPSTMVSTSTAAPPTSLVPPSTFGS